MREGHDARISPGGPRELGAFNWSIAKLIGIATGGPPPNIFTTLGRHRGLFRRWLWFAAALMPGGKIPRNETELLILRVAHNTDSEYEWNQHARLALSAGLSEVEIERVRVGPAAEGWSERQSALLEATDQLHSQGRIGETTWTTLSRFYDDVELIEICMLVGHYEMLAMTLNTLRVEPDPIPSSTSLPMRLLARRSRRRVNAGE